MKTLYTLLLVSTLASGCVVEEGYYVNRGTYYEEAPVVVQTRPNWRPSRHHHKRYYRQNPNIHRHPSAAPQAPEVIIVPNEHGHPRAPAYTQKDANTHGHPAAAPLTPPNTHGHP